MFWSYFYETCFIRHFATQKQNITWSDGFLSFGGYSKKCGSITPPAYDRFNHYSEHADEVRQNTFLVHPE